MIEIEKLNNSLMERMAGLDLAQAERRDALIDTMTRLYTRLEGGGQNA